MEFALVRTFFFFDRSVAIYAGAVVGSTLNYKNTPAYRVNAQQINTTFGKLRFPLYVRRCKIAGKLQSYLNSTWTFNDPGICAGHVRLFPIFH